MTQPYMNFEEFRIELELELSRNVEFELQEFQYHPQSFGNGLVAYRISGRIFKIEYEGRERELCILVSEPHQKYIGASFTELDRVYDLANSLTAVLELFQANK